MEVVIGESQDNDAFERATKERYDELYSKIEAILQANPASTVKQDWAEYRCNETVLKGVLDEKELIDSFLKQLV